MTEEPIDPTRRRRIALVLAVPAILVLAYAAVMAGVRACRDARIAGTLDQPLPEFALVDAAGTTWSPAALRGRPALLHFFRSRCEACEAEAPEYRALEASLPEAEARILHVMTDRVLDFPEAETKATLAAKGFRRAVVHADRALIDAFHGAGFAQVTPITYVVDANGRIRDARRGAQKAETLRELVRKPD